MESGDLFKLTKGRPKVLEKITNTKIAKEQREWTIIQIAKTMLSCKYLYDDKRQNRAAKNGEKIRS